EEGRLNEKIYVVDSDLAKSTTTHKFQKEFPNRFVETGIAEQNAVSITTGIADEGKIPFYVNFAIFVSGTAWTQVRQACYANANIKLIATHPGMDGGYDGASHHANEDLALMRSLPNMVVLVPSNHDEFKRCIKIAIEHKGPVYIRAARDVVPDLPAIQQVEIGKSYCMLDNGNDFAMIYEGSSTDLAFRAFDQCKKEGLNGKLINIFCIKPLDEKYILTMAKEVKTIITIENHSVIAGLGGAICESVAKLNHHAPIVRIGVEDVFTESGPSLEIKEKYGLNVQNIVFQLKESLKK
ncbi:MAG: transketolase C-terminal domain-containing protein, partial [Coprobacillus sp.]